MDIIFALKALFWIAATIALAALIVSFVYAYKANRAYKTYSRLIGSAHVEDTKTWRDRWTRLRHGDRLFTRIFYIALLVEILSILGRIIIEG